METFRQNVFSQETERESPKKVIIVGGGLSGSALALAVLEKGMTPVLVEACASSQQMVAKDYLVTYLVAEELGMENIWLRIAKSRGKITGFSTYQVNGSSLEYSEGISPDWETDDDNLGFVVFTQGEILGELWPRILRGGGKIMSGTKAIGIEEGEDNFHLRLSGNERIEGNLIIDATGLNMARRGDWGLFPQDINKESRVRMVYGFQVYGCVPSDRLLFLTGFCGEKWGKGLGAYLMPRGESEAELVINQEVAMSKALSWYSGAHQKWLEVVNLMRQINGVRIDGWFRKALASGFRASSANWNEIKQWDRRGVVPFGEMIGFNWPSIGQLIDIIYGNANKLADLVVLRPPDRVNAAFYRQWRKRLNYPLLTALAATKQAWLRENGLSTTPLSLALTSSVSPKELWPILRGGNNLISPETLKLVLENPKCWSFIAQVILRFLPLLLNEAEERLRLSFL